ncbi:MAG: head-tail connector protein [Lautropia sp.]
MPLVTVDDVKLHAVIALDHDDFYIETIVIPTAESAVQKYLGFKLPELDTAGDPLPVDAVFLAAIYLTCAAFMEDREGKDGLLPPAAKSLLWPHRRLGIA